MSRMKEVKLEVRIKAAQRAVDLIKNFDCSDIGCDRGCPFWIDRAIPLTVSLETTHCLHNLYADARKKVL